MKAVVDTNVVAYYLLGNVEFSAEVRRFWEDVDDALAPSIWEAELANVVWMSIRAGVLRGPSGPVKLRLAAQLGINTVATQSLWHGALRSKAALRSTMRYSSNSPSASVRRS